MRGLRRGVHDQLDLRRACSANTRSHAVGVADVHVERAELRELAPTSRSVTGLRGGVGPEEARPHVVLEADHVDSPARTKCATDSEPIRPPEPVTMAIAMRA